MKTIKRNKPTAEIEAYELRNFAFNSSGNFFIIYKDDLNDKEKIITFNQNEFRMLKQFMEKFK